jgi:hypothetical protein
VTDPALIAVLERCLGLERRAAALYQRLATAAADGDARAFWREAALDEGRHIGHWERLLQEARRSALPSVIDDPGAVAAELRAVDAEAADLAAAAAAAPDFSGTFTAALRLELAMLHPAFALLFHFADSQPGLAPPAAEYEAHLRRFGAAARRFAPGTAEALALAERAVLLLWERNRELARQAREIRGLRACLPVCAACRKIRDADGQWQPFERYLEAHAGVSFTHGLCPTCAEETLRAFDADSAAESPPAAAGPEKQKGGDVA